MPGRYLVAGFSPDQGLCRHPSRKLYLTRTGAWLAAALADSDGVDWFPVRANEVISSPSSKRRVRARDLPVWAGIDT